MNHSNRFLVPLLLTGSVLVFASACDDDTSETPPPAPRYQPSPVDFEFVSVTEERTIDVVVSNDGGSPYLVSQMLLTGGSDAELFELGAIPPELTTPPGLSIGQTATVSVTFRPCPAAIADPTNTDGCPFNERRATLSVIDNTVEGGVEVAVQGVAGLPPNLKVECGRTCNDNSNLGDCTTVNFGAQSVGSSCELPVIVCNEFVTEGAADAIPTGDLRMESIGITVQEIVNGVFGPIVNGPSAGFEVLNADDTPLSPSFADPVVVSGVPDCDAPGAGFEFKIRFGAQTNANYIGRSEENNGFRLVYNNPTEPERAITVNASGVGPRLDVIRVTRNGSFDWPSGTPVQFRGVTQGECAEEVFRLLNNGSDDLELTAAAFNPVDPELTFRITMDVASDVPVSLPTTMTVVDNERVLKVEYCPTDDQSDSTDFFLECDDPGNCPWTLPVVGGNQPLLALNPGTVQYQSTGGSVQCRDVTIRNEGDAELQVTQLEVRAIDDGDPASRDDFFVDLDACSRDEPICDLAPPISVAAGNETTVAVCYENNDTSLVDAANLRVLSNDPTAPEGVRTVSLVANDSPCFPPNVDLSDAFESPVCVNQINVVDLDLVAQQPGGVDGANTLLSQCTLRVLQGPALEFDPNPVTEMSRVGPWQSSFVPELPTGVRFIRATCLNSCGAEGSGDALIQVTEQNCD